MRGSRSRHLRELLLCICVIGGIIVFDQLVKYWARMELQNIPGQMMGFVPGIMSLRYMQNTGAAFSMWSGATQLLGVLSAALSVLIIWLLYKYRDNPSCLLRLSLCFIAGGALGNVIDRMTLGYVVDMLEFDFVRFAVFNVADSFVCVGAVMFCVYVLFCTKSADEKEQDQTDAG